MKRIPSFDLARGFTVLIMPAAHVLMLYGNPAVHQTLLSDLFRFLAEGPGAQLFMLLMGVSFTFSKRITKSYIIQRAFYLLAAAYLLNFFKFIVPLGLGFLPENLLEELHLKHDLTAVTFFLMIGDILHFAAIAYLILFLVYKLKHYALWSLAIAIAIMMLSPYVWDLKTELVFVDQLLILFNGHPPETFFPVFPWLVYPLLGLVFGHMLKQNNIHYLLKKTGVAGLGLMIASLCFPPTTEMDPWLPFYRTRPADTLFHIGFVLVWLSVFHWISRKIPSNHFFSLLSFCSRHITTIYLVQWILICWCLAFTGYMQLGLMQTLGWMAANTLITLLLTWRIQKSYASRKSI